MLFFRRLTKLTIAGFLYYTGLMRLIAKRRLKKHPEERFKILTYHRVLQDEHRKKADTQPGMCVTETTFASQMDYIAKQANPISLIVLANGLEHEGTLPERPVVVTFDDGWLDNYTVAFPVLKKHNIPATIFLPTDLIISDKLPSFIHASLLLGESDIWPAKAVAAFKEVALAGNLAQSDPALEEHKLDATGTDAFTFMVTFMHLSQNDMEKVITLMLASCGISSENWYNQRWLINWDEIREMNGSIIEFGSHGQSHELMTSITPEQVAEELTESKRIIESELHEQITLFSYPNGNYNEEIKQLVKEAGYSCAVTQTGCLTDETLPERYALRRINMNEGSTMGPFGSFSKAMFACKIEGIL